MRRLSKKMRAGKEPESVRPQQASDPALPEDKVD